VLQTSENTRRIDRHVLRIETLMSSIRCRGVFGVGFGSACLGLDRNVEGLLLLAE